MAYFVLGLAAWLAVAPTLFGAETGRRYAPTIFVGGIVNGASFTPAPNNFVAPNSIISIFGAELSLQTRQVRPDDIVSGRLPQLLANVTVSIGGLPASLFFVSPGQINAQVPSTILPGRWVLQVNRENLLSNTAMIEVRALSPGLFAWPSSFVEGPLRAAVTHQDFTPVGRANPEGATPAHPGELIVLWATGFGPTIPAVFDGELPDFAARLALPSKVWINGVAIPSHLVFYAGQAPGLAGLYQVNVKLSEDTPTGDIEVMVEVNGVQSQPGTTIPIDPIPEP